MQWKIYANLQTIFDIKNVLLTFNAITFTVFTRKKLSNLHLLDSSDMHLCRNITASSACPLQSVVLSQLFLCKNCVSKTFQFNFKQKAHLGLCAWKDKLLVLTWACSNKDMMLVWEPINLKLHVALHGLLHLLSF